MAHNAYLDHRVLVGWGEGETTQHAVEFAYLWNIEAVEIVEDTLAMSIQKHNSHHRIHVLQTICANNCWQTTNSNRTRNHMHQPEANAIVEGRVQVNTPFKISNCCRVLQHYVTFDATSLWLSRDLGRKVNIAFIYNCFKNGRLVVETTCQLGVICHTRQVLHKVSTKFWKN